jgi:hypothetical protein
MLGCAHARVRQEALRYVSTTAGPDSAPLPLQQWDDDGNPLPPPDPTIDKVSGIDWDQATPRPSKQARGAVGASTVLPVSPVMPQGGRPERESAATGSADQIVTGPEKWWQRRYQVRAFIAPPSCWLLSPV